MVTQIETWALLQIVINAYGSCYDEKYIISSAHNRTFRGWQLYRDKEPSVIRPWRNGSAVCPIDLGGICHAKHKFQDKVVFVY